MKILPQDYHSYQCTLGLYTWWKMPLYTYNRALHLGENAIVYIQQGFTLGGKCYCTPTTGLYTWWKMLLYPYNRALHLVENTIVYLQQGFTLGGKYYCIPTTGLYTWGKMPLYTYNRALHLVEMLPSRKTNLRRQSIFLLI